VSVQWTKEDPECKHEGILVAVDQDGATWPDSDRSEWWSLFDGPKAPEGMFGLRAVCDGPGCGWRSDMVAALVIDEAGEVEIDTSENAAYGPHHDHVRQVMGVAENREARREIRGLFEDIMYRPGLSEIDRVGLFTRVVQLGEEYRSTAVWAAKNAGATWVDLGAALETSKQAAQQRYQRQVEAANAENAAWEAKKAADPAWQRE
jgi:hypothetical protein